MRFFVDNWNAGLSMLHNIWTREHNAVCDMFLAKYVHVLCDAFLP